MRILIIEDEHNIALPLKKAFERRQFAVDHVDNGAEGLESASINEYDCILLDLNLPQMDGIEVATSLRAKGINTPILMLTARTSQQNKWEGFEAGTDDYVTKPFDLKELIYRVQALIRNNSKEKSDKLEAGNISLESSSFKVFINDEQIFLNNKEFGVLEYLLRNKGKVVSQEELLEHVWDSEINLFTQTVRTHIKTLRKKVDPDKKLIKTIKGQGYVIE